MGYAVQLDDNSEQSDSTHPALAGLDAHLAGGTRMGTYPRQPEL